MHQRCRHTDCVSSHNRPQHSTHQPLHTRLILARRSTPEAMILWSMQTAYGVGNVRAMPDAVSLTFAGVCVCVLCFRVHADSCLDSVKLHAVTYGRCRYGSACGESRACAAVCRVVRL
jgi:hypothetical protein